HAAFPRGLDLVLTAPGVVAGLPRSSRPVPSPAPSPVPSEA
ncbi:phosphonate C-P lyase system protein PhnH, partial [Methylobacterium sp. WL6]